MLKEKISRQGKWICTFLFLSLEVFLHCHSCKHILLQKYPWRIFIPKYLGKKINFDAEFLAVSHTHKLMLEQRKFPTQKGWQPARRV